MSKMEERYSAISKGLEEIKEASASSTMSAAGPHGKFGDKEDDDKMDKKASASYDMIKNMSAAIFNAAREKDSGKRMAAIEEALGSEVVTKMASLEDAVNEQNKTIRRQNAELARPRIDFLSKTYEAAGADRARMKTMNASWNEMGLDELDEEVQRVNLLRNSYGMEQPSPVRAARLPIDSSGTSDRSYMMREASAPEAEDDDTNMHELFMKPLAEMR